MANVLGVVQLMHPGNEQIPDVGTLKWWNSGRPGRRFLKSPGYAIAGLTAFTGEIEFWGEWEPESEVVEEIAQPLPDGPHYIYHPYYVQPRVESLVKPQSTETFIFGDQFLYIDHRQYTRKGPTHLRYLSRGSVILFCSYLHAAIYLDTVFVVSHWIDFGISNFYQQLESKVADTYADVTLLPWYQHNITEDPTGGEVGGGFQREKSYRLYFGATYDNPVEGMYSYFPCRPYTPGGKGFERPEIRLAILTTKYLQLSNNITVRRDVCEVAQYWRQVKEQVLENGLMLGLEAEMPECRGRDEGSWKDEG